MKKLKFQHIMKKYLHTQYSYVKSVKVSACNVKVYVSACNDDIASYNKEKLYTINNIFKIFL